MEPKVLTVRALVVVLAASCGCSDTAADPTPASIPRVHRVAIGDVVFDAEAERLLWMADQVLHGPKLTWHDDADFRPDLKIDDGMIKLLANEPNRGVQ